MVRHCSLFRFRDGTPAVSIDAIVVEFRRLAAAVPAVRSAAIGRNIGFHDANFHMAANLEFESLDGYRAYCVDETHPGFVDEHLLPILESRVAVQFELSAVAD